MVRPVSQFKERSQEGESEEVCVCTVTRVSNVHILYDPNDMFNYSIQLDIVQVIECCKLGEAYNFINQFDIAEGGIGYNSSRQKQFPSKRCQCPIALDNGRTLFPNGHIVSAIHKLYTLSSTGKQRGRIEFRNGTPFPYEMPEFAKQILTSPTQQITLGVGVTYPIEEEIGKEMATELNKTDVDSEGFPTLNALNNCKECCK